VAKAMRFNFEFSNLCGTVYSQGNLCFAPDGGEHPSVCIHALFSRTAPLKHAAVGEPEHLM